MVTAHSQDKPFTEIHIYQIIITKLLLNKVVLKILLKINLLALCQHLWKQYGLQAFSNLVYTSVGVKMCLLNAIGSDMDSAKYNVNDHQDAFTQATCSSGLGTLLTTYH